MNISFILTDLELKNDSYINTSNQQPRYCYAMLNRGYSDEEMCDHYAASTDFTSDEYSRKSAERNHWSIGPHPSTLLLTHPSTDVAKPFYDSPHTRALFGEKSKVPLIEEASKSVGSTKPWGSHLSNGAACSKLQIGKDDVKGKGGSLRDYRSDCPKTLRKDFSSLDERSEQILFRQKDHNNKDSRHEVQKNDSTEIRHVRKDFSYSSEISSSGSFALSVWDGISDGGSSLEESRSGHTHDGVIDVSFGSDASSDICRSSPNRQLYDENENHLIPKEEGKTYIIYLFL